MLKSCIVILGLLLLPPPLTAGEGCPTSFSSKLTRSRPLKAFPTIKLISGNAAKWNTYRELADKAGIQLERESIDIEEIYADPISVVVHKASSYPANTEATVLVEDTQLMIQGAEPGMFGVLLRYHIRFIEKYFGKQATWQVLLAHRKGKHIRVYRAAMEGKLGEDMHEKFDQVRRKAFRKLLSGRAAGDYQEITTWEGSYQGQEMANNIYESIKKTENN